MFVAAVGSIGRQSQYVNCLLQLFVSEKSLTVFMEGLLQQWTVIFPKGSQCSWLVLYTQITLIKFDWFCGKTCQSWQYELYQFLPAGRDYIHHCSLKLETIKYHPINIPFGLWRRRDTRNVICVTVWWTAAISLLLMSESSWLGNFDSSFTNTACSLQCRVHVPVQLQSSISDSGQGQWHHPSSMLSWFEVAWTTEVMSGRICRNAIGN